MSSNLFDIRHHVLPCQHIREYSRATRHAQEDTLYLDIKQYQPLDNLAADDGSVTIIGAGGTGFPKEMYEPLWDDILSHSKKSNGFKIRSIWMADMSNQGASGVLNEDTQGDDPSWFDHSRDLLHMVNTFRDQIVRPIVGIGHSIGGTALVNVSLLHARLLSALVLFDPIIQPSAHQGVFLAYFSNEREDSWPNRATAEEFFRKSNFHRSWDRRVLEKWLRFGLRDQTTQAYLEDGKQIEGEVNIALTTPKHQESWTYIRPYFSPLVTNLSEALLRENRQRYPDADPSTLRTHPFYRAETDLTLDKLPLLRPRVLYVFPQKSPMSTPALHGTKMETTGIGKGGSGGVKAGKVKSVDFERGSHLITFEKPDPCAEIVVGWMLEWFREWKQEERTEMEEGARGKSEIEGNRLVISKEWRDRTKAWMADFLKSKAEAKL